MEGDKKRIIIIGASYLQYPLVEKANAMGLETHCFAWEEGAVAKEISDFFYPISIQEKEMILQEARKIDPHGVATIASDFAIITVNYLAEKLGLVGNSVIATELLTHKYKMRSQLASSGLPCPKFFLIKKVAELQDCPLSSYPLIVKPVDRSGSRGVTKVLSEKALEESVEYALKDSFVKEVIIEDFIEGEEVSVEGISWKGNHHILNITDKVTSKAPHFVELEHHQPSYQPVGIQEAIKKIIPKALDALMLKNGASHSELLITSAGEIFITEIGGRMGGDFIGSHLVELSTGYDYLKGVIDISLGEFSEPDISLSKHSGVYYYSALSKHVRKYIENPAQTEGIVESALFEEVDISSLSHSGERAGYFIYQGDSKLTIGKD